MQPTRKHHILCVDDHEDTCFMLTTLLGLSDYKVTTASSVSEALRLAHSEDFDLYILDGRLADGGGVDLCLKIREFDPQAFIIFYTGAAYESDRRAGLCAGAYAYIVKPDIEELSAAVSELLDVKRGANFGRDVSVADSHHAEGW